MINSAFHWNSQVDINKDVVDELVFWKTIFVHLTVFPSGLRNKHRPE